MCEPHQERARPRVVVFAGPTIDATAIRALVGDAVDLIIRPPVTQGDVYRAAQRQPAAIGIIDGYFERIPAVWHKEILHAMQEGVEVCGAASMGALRAAELHQFGMIGIGTIFERYSNAELVADDEVAIAHASAEDEYRASSEALVNIRATLDQASACAVIDPDVAAMALDSAREMFYPERSWPAVLDALVEAGAAEPAEALREWLPGGRVDQKRIDAEQMLVRLRDDVVGGVTSPPVRFRLSHTVWWDHLVQHAGVVVEDHELETAGQDPATVVLDAVLDELRLVPAEHQQVWLSGLMRQLALEEAERRGLQATPSAVRERANQLCVELGIATDEAFTGWLAAVGLDLRRFNELVAEQVRIDQVVALVAPAAMGNLVDTLRLAGRYDVIERAMDKERVLAGRGLENPALSVTGLAGESALLDWWAGRSRFGPSQDLSHEAALAGFADAASFTRALLREYLYAGPGGVEPEGQVDTS